jgi:hypothetical protein
VCLAAFLGGAAGAHASPFIVSIMEDEYRHVYGTAAERRRTLDQMKALGADAIRVTVMWDYIAPNRRPADGHRVASYRPAAWDPYDDLVRAATARGLLVNFNPTPPGPDWAHPKASDSKYAHTWKPSAREFGRFVQALGTRYSGRYHDENSGGSRLPRVSWWSTINEPNQQGWLSPQSIPSKSGPLPYSPVLYRELLIFAASALLRSGHGNDLLLFGETAPVGEEPENARRPLRPALFIRELFCLARSLRRYTGAAARARRCDRVEKLEVLQEFARLGFGHHPYVKRVAPNKSSGLRDAITMANIGSLPALLDKIARRTQLFPVGIPVLLTEFGYETNPPDPYVGVSLQRQAQYLNLADYLAWRQPRIFANAQYLLYDARPRSQYVVGSKPYWFTYQSGLFTANLKPKPAAKAWALPLVLRKRSDGRRLIWGQLRFAPNATTQTVYLQSRPSSSAAWQYNAPPITVRNAMGIFTSVRNSKPGRLWRAVWVAPDGSRIVTSRGVRSP